VRIVRINKNVGKKTIPEEEVPLIRENGISDVTPKTYKLQGKS
jgi:hypothetical protein